MADPQARYKSPFGRQVKVPTVAEATDKDSNIIFKWSPYLVFEAVKSGMIHEDTVDPTATDDTDAGYFEGALWVNTTTDEAFICLDDTATAAVWKSITSGGGGGGGGGAVTYWETVTVWTLISGNEYYADVNHAFGTKDVFVVTRDSVTDEWVDTGLDAIDTNNIRVLVTGNTHSIRVGVTTGITANTQITTLNSWTLDIGNEYYADFAHGFGSEDVTVSLYETTTKQDVDAVVERTDSNTVRVKVTGNTHSLRTTVRL